jgi:hypothetical protein
MNVMISVEGIGGENKHKDINGFRTKSDLRETIRGAVEDQSWMNSRSKDQVHTILGKYFYGILLRDLAEECWAFIEKPTDWYSRARLEDVSVMYDDEIRAVAEALISIEDMDTGYNETGKGLFAMIMTPDGWKINYVSFSWSQQEGKYECDYNGASD